MLSEPLAERRTRTRTKRVRAHTHDARPSSAVVAKLGRLEEQIDSALEPITIPAKVRERANSTGPSLQAVEQA